MGDAHLRRRRTAADGASWGIQLFQAQTRLVSAPHLLGFPALFLVLAVGSLLRLGRAVGRTGDPLS